ncbi:MAG: UPF0182 family protein [Chloroflexi bacterium]|nr:UPF0182 family protein [Chloroflexota bacterium]
MTLFDGGRRDPLPPDDQPPGAPMPTFSARWLLIAIGVGLALVLLNMVRSTYTEYLWFDDVRYTGVYLKTTITQVLLFLAGAILVGGLLRGNLLLAQRASEGPPGPQVPLEMAAMLRRLLAAGISFGTLVVAFVFGSIATGEWTVLLRFLEQVPFGKADPLFNQDLGFYVFSLPLFRFVQSWLLGAFIVTLLGVFAVCFLNFSLQGLVFRFSRGLKAHVLALGAVIMALLAFGYWLDTFDLVFSPRGAVFGATFTDVNAELIALRLLIVIALAVAAVLVASIFQRGFRLPLTAVAIWLAVAIVGANVYPAVVQRFDVEPNEFVREERYIGHNIRMTRDAFSLDRVKDEQFPAGATVTDLDLRNNPDTVNNIRLWDHRPLKDTYNQIQFIRLYYEFHDIDVDRYVVNGQYRQVMLAAREMVPERLPAEAQRWVNQRLQYTHGYGVAMSPVTEFTPEGRPMFFAKDVPPEGAFQIKEPRIYFGERTSNYVVVNTNTVEFDYPTPEDKPVYTRYGGSGGVLLDSFLRRLAYAWEFSDINILVSNELTPQSRIMYRRNIAERVRRITPFLRLDRDPYVVVGEDGKLYWIQDAYTVTDRYPYSQPYRLGFNYIRNSVKAVVDAYEGTVTYYVAEPDDPLIRSYAGVFPGVFQPMEKMPAFLRSHVRYPEDLFLIQAEMFLKYHMTDPRVFYNQEDLWSMPQEVYYDTTIQMQPYYINMRLPGETREEFVLILPFTPKNKPNLVAWIAARMDAPNYGRLLSFRFPKDRQIDGPTQVEARISNHPDIAYQLNLWNQGGSRVIRGNLLVIPIGQAILYVEPIYLQAAALAFPELKRVVVASGDRVYMASSLSEGLRTLAGQVVAPPPPQPTTASGTSAGAVIRQELERLQQSLKSLQDGVKQMQESISRLLEMSKQ